MIEKRNTSFSALVLLLLFILTSLFAPIQTQVSPSSEVVPEDDGGSTSSDTDSLCPRYREEAAARGRQCLRKCSVDADCISSRKRCLCDGQCGWSCVRPDLNCDELTSVKDGSYDVSGDYFGARVIYSCNDGFFMSGSKERVCQGDGSWSDSAPTCKEKAMCGVPPNVPHARHNANGDQKEYPTDSMVEYECFVGYEASGFAKAKCLYYNGTAQWFGPDLKCLPKSCGHPGEIEDGKREGSVFTFTNKISYVCNEGFDLVGRANRYCQSNGIWSGIAPTCVPIKCSVPEEIENGKVYYAALNFNATIRYECNYGFKLNGPEVRRCDQNKQWTAITTFIGPESGQSSPGGNLNPICKQIDCGSPGNLPNGFLEGQKTTLGSVIKFRCFDETTFDGTTNSTTCTESGKWSHPLPSCLAPCVVPLIENGRINSAAAGSKLPHGSIIEAICKPQYESAVSNTTVSMCNNGSWTVIPFCVPERCKQLPERPKNGLVIAPKTDHGMKAAFRCRDGFTLVGSNVTRCHFGKWTESTPTCQEIYCPFPGTIENGRVLLVGHMGMYDYRPYVRKVTNKKQIMFECDRGFFVTGPSGATCVDGSWSPSYLPTCERGSHPILTWSRRRRKRSLYEVADTMSALDDHGRNAQSSASDQQQQKQISPSQAPCSFQPSSPWMEVSIIQGNDSFHDGSIIQIKCTQGFKLNFESPENNNNSTARCVRGLWKPKEPECVLSPCSTPLLPNGNYVRHNKQLPVGHRVSHLESIFVQCKQGFVSTGSTSVKCWLGNWTFTSSPPECSPSPCTLPDLKFGLYAEGYRSGLTINHGNFIQYECKKGFTKGTEVVPRCIQGQLKPEPPHCISFAVLNSDRVREDVDKNVYNEYEFDEEDEEDGSVENDEKMILKSVSESDQMLLESLSELEFRLNHSQGEQQKVSSSNESSMSKPYSFRTKSWNISLDHFPGPNDQSNETGDEQMEREAIYLEISANKSCFFSPPATVSNVIAFHGDVILDSNTEFLAGTELTFRCSDIGKYELVGSPRRTCTYGKWTGKDATCFGLSQEHDYALDKPPTVLFRHQLGPIAQSNDGKLIVYPGIILHLECLYIRKFGSPVWKVKHYDSIKDDYLSDDEYNYTQGWTSEVGRDSSLEYRLSIYETSSNDSGIYSCVTPIKHQTSIEIVVKAVHCPEIPSESIEGLIVSDVSTKMGSTVLFTCKPGMKLSSARGEDDGSDPCPVPSHVTCLPSGQWSSSIPTCTAFEN